MRSALLLCVFLGLARVTIQNDYDDSNSHGNEHSNDGLDIYQNNAGFAFQLYKQITAQPESQSKNIFFSPMSLSLALAALSLGARGQTHQQLFNGLGFNETEIAPEEVNEAFHGILMNLNKKKDMEVSVGSALFVKDTFKPHPEFLENLKRFYHAEGFTVDFNKTAEATELINNYVKEKTHGKITNLVKNLNTDAMMYLISYIYFKGKWELPFDPLNTKENNFYVDENTTVSVKMMHQRNNFPVYHDEEIAADVLQLLYRDSVSMMLVLPENELKALEEILQGRHVEKWHKWIEKTECEVFLPKFSISTSYSLEDVLKNMGITDIFSENADFAGISEHPRIPKTSTVIHQATLDIDELGTTGSAVTGIAIKPLSFFSPHTLNFNRPFLLIIYSHETKSILFLGRIVNPADS
ncbi:alpha-1-antitrypsin-like [Brienomyrus brachyistius]|uniref:alpha-1-antitrypsin-like n=1 Tax=Brienomyrus brachyistius TaxID=42636 RepID=UPI0020B26811|nr:alpha-1-antitrypsin-like [Brienomyrus brachyistius]